MRTLKLPAARALAALAILACVGGANAAPPRPDGVQVPPAAQGHPTSLRGAKLTSDEFGKSRVEHPMPPRPSLDGAFDGSTPTASFRIPGGQ